MNLYYYKQQFCVTNIFFYVFLNFKRKLVCCVNPFDKCLYALYISPFKYILSMKAFKKLTTFSLRMSATNE